MKTSDFRNCAVILRRVPQYILVGHATAVVDASSHNYCTGMCLRSMVCLYRVENLIRFSTIYEVEFLTKQLKSILSVYLNKSDDFRIFRDILLITCTIPNHSRVSTDAKIKS
uniref:Uncharacterized protein n=1 Tax=Wuchereria bancrofti TaxID=6293 RepID=A0AAF5RTL7_WUCBA